MSTNRPPHDDTYGYEDPFASSGEAFDASHGTRHGGGFEDQQDQNWIDEAVPTDDFVADDFADTAAPAASPKTVGAETPELQDDGYTEEAAFETDDPYAEDQASGQADDQADSQDIYDDADQPADEGEAEAEDGAEEEPAAKASKWLFPAAIAGFVAMAGGFGYMQFFGSADDSARPIAVANVPAMPASSLNAANNNAVDSPVTSVADTLGAIKPQQAAPNAKPMPFVAESNNAAADKAQDQVVVPGVKSTIPAPSAEPVPPAPVMAAPVPAAPVPAAVAAPAAPPVDQPVLPPVPSATVPAAPTVRAVAMPPAPVPAPVVSAPVVSAPPTPAPATVPAATAQEKTPVHIDHLPDAAPAVDASVKAAPVHAAVPAPVAQLPAPAPSGEVAEMKATIDALKAQVASLNAQLQKAPVAAPVVSAPMPVVTAPAPSASQDLPAVAEAKQSRKAAKEAKAAEKAAKAAEKKAAKAEARKAQKVASHDAHKAAAPSHKSSAPVENPSGFVLRGATPGSAWVAPVGNPGALRQVTMGETLPGIGQIIAIHNYNGRWFVEGTNGFIQ
jgi:hypothetical protein